MALSSGLLVEILGDEVKAAALIDRLVHHCYLVTIRRFIVSSRSGLNQTTPSGAL
jgi:hypothetical protein